MTKAPPIFQQKYGAHVVLGAADWDMIEKSKKADAWRSAET